METQVLGRRIVAGWIDVLLSMAAFYGVAAAQGNADTSGSSWSIEVTGGGAVLLFFGWLAYHVVGEATVGKTVGKALLGLRVVREGGGSAGFGKALIRTLMRVVDVLPVFYLVGVIAVAATEHDQRLGDLTAGTFVVRG